MGRGVQWGRVGRFWVPWPHPGVGGWDMWGLQRGQAALGWNCNRASEEEGQACSCRSLPCVLWVPHFPVPCLCGPAMWSGRSRWVLFRSWHSEHLELSPGQAAGHSRTPESCRTPSCSPAPFTAGAVSVASSQEWSWGGAFVGGAHRWVSVPVHPTLSYCSHTIVGMGGRSGM